MWNGAPDSLSGKVALNGGKAALRARNIQAMIEITENKEYRLKTDGSTPCPNDIQNGSGSEPQPSVTQPIVTQSNEAKLNETQQSGGKGSVEGEPLYDYETLLIQSNMWGMDKKRMDEFINAYGINEAYKELRRWHDANENPNYFGKSYMQ